MTLGRNSSHSTAVCGLKQLRDTDSVALLKRSGSELKKNNAWARVRLLFVLEEEHKQQPGYIFTDEMYLHRYLHVISPFYT